MSSKRHSSPSHGIIRLVFLVPLINHYFFPTGAYLFLEAASPFISSRRHIATTIMSGNNGNNLGRGMSKARSKAFAAREPSVMEGKGARVKVLDRPTTSIPSKQQEAATILAQPRGGASAKSVKKPRVEPNVWSATALVAGTTVGAGILALPAVTISSGFIPSSLTLILAWIYMVISALLIAEVNLNITSSHSPSGGMVSMTQSTIGPAGAYMAGTAYLFLHYALLVAYIAQGGEVLLSSLGKLLPFIPQSLPGWTAPVLFTSLFGGSLVFGNKKFMEDVNNFFVLVVVASFAGLVGLASSQVEFSRLLVQEWTSVFSAVPVMFVSLVFHNVVPYLEKSLEGNPRRIRQAIVIGSALPLVMFITWNAVVLGIVNPSSVPAGVAFDPLAILRKGDAGGNVGNLVSLFSEFAIITSFTGFVYGLKDFFQDITGKFPKLLSTPDSRATVDLLSYAAILIPPMAVAAIDPTIFLPALEYAGTFGICVLFGIFPAVMAHITRRKKAADKEYVQMVPGGDGLLGLQVAIPSAIIMQTILEKLFPATS